MHIASLFCWLFSFRLKQWLNLVWFSFSLHWALNFLQQRFVCIFFNIHRFNLFLFSCYKRFISWLQLRVVRAVAILGGLLQIFLFMCLCGIIASVRLIIVKMIRFIDNKSTFVPKLKTTLSSCDISDDIPWIRHFTLFTTITNIKALA